MPATLSKALPSLSVIKLSEVAARPVRWLWPGRVPRGKVTLLCGDPGLGKSFLTAYLAARITRGGSAEGDFCDGPGVLHEPASALFLSAEDDAGDTIRPRIEAEGGDPRLVEIAMGVKLSPPAAGGVVGGRAEDTDVLLDRHTEHLLAHINRMHRPRLVVIDPISAYMGDADSHNNAQVRAVLGRLAAVAMKTGVAVVCVTHMNKRGAGGAGDGAGKAVYRAMGSLAFTAAARIVWQVSKVAGASATDRALTLVKSNIECRRTGLKYRIAPAEGAKPGEPGPVRVHWLDTNLELDADDAENHEAVERRSMVEEAAAWLVSLLDSRGGVLPATEIVELAEREGMSASTLRRAKIAMAGTVEAGRRSAGNGGAGEWVWYLRRSATPPQGAQVARCASPAAEDAHLAKRERLAGTTGKGGRR